MYAHSFCAYEETSHSALHCISVTFISLKQKSNDSFLVSLATNLFLLINLHFQRSLIEFYSSNFTISVRDQSTFAFSKLSAGLQHFEYLLKSLVTTNHNQ